MESGIIRPRSLDDYLEAVLAHWEIQTPTRELLYRRSTKSIKNTDFAFALGRIKILIEPRLLIPYRNFSVLRWVRTLILHTRFSLPFNFRSRAS